MVARGGLIAWVKIPGLLVAQIGVLSKKTLGCAEEKILKVPDQ